MLLSDLLPIWITNGDDFVDDIKHVLKFSNTELKTPLVFFAMVRDNNRERRMMFEREGWSVGWYVDQKWRRGTKDGDMEPFYVCNSQT